MNKIIPLWKLNYFRKVSVKRKFTIDKYKRYALFAFNPAPRNFRAVILYVPRCQFMEVERAPPLFLNFASL